jgi:replicative DNA helicase
MESGRLRIIDDPFYIQKFPKIIESLKVKVPLGCVFIDYIQKIKNKQRFGTRQLELANTSNIILETAKRYSIPIILGAQLGRDKESKNKVKLDNLREAGDLEQDANLVLGLHNQAMEEAQEKQTQLTSRKVDLTITPLKNRNGIVNKTILLEFDRPLLRIKDKDEKKS